MRDMSGVDYTQIFELELSDFRGKERIRGPPGIVSETRGENKGQQQKLMGKTKQ